MRQPDLEAQFLRYRDQGDLRALGRIFDAVAPEMLAVARHLAGPGTDAEDLLQASFLSVLQRPEGFDAGRRLRPWLLGILANHARRARERAGREVDAERLGQAAEAGPLEDASADELSRALAGVLEQCPASYASVLRLHLRGLKPREIARELDVSPGAARVRLHRGLKLLRQALPAGFAYGAAATLVSGRGLAAVREVVMASAARKAGVAAVGTAWFANVKLLALAPLLLLAGAGVYLFGGPWSSSEAHGVEPDPGSGGGIADEETEEGEKRVEQVGAPAPVTPQSVPSTTTSGSPVRAALLAETEASDAWSFHESEHYYLLSANPDVDFVGELLTRIERMHAVYSRACGSIGTEPEDKSVLRLCGSAEVYASYGGPPSSAGYWDVRRSEVVLFDQPERASTWITLQHEAWHQYVTVRCGKLPAHSWWEEGLGDVFGAYVADGTRLVRAESAWRASTLRTALREERVAPLDELITWTPALYFGQNRHGIGAGVNYATGWGLVDFLTHGAGSPEWQAEWGELCCGYLAALSAGEDRDAAVARVFDGIDWLRLERAWRAYILGE